MPNPTPDYPTPWAIACVFRNEKGDIFQTLNLLPAHRESDAAGAAVSMYYRNGGTLPLFSVVCAQVSEEMCRGAVAMYDETARLQKAETDKVVVGGFRVLDNTPMPSPTSESVPPMWPPKTYVADDPPEGAA